jgi:methionine-rich copper-binding protein CopC
MRSLAFTGTLLAGLSIVSALGFAPEVAAHAVIVASTPMAGAVVPPGDLDAALRFNSRVDRPRSRLTLVAADGKTRPLDVAADSAPDLLAAKIVGLAPGQYRIRWQVLAVDGHLTRGDIPFSVKEP